MPPKKTPCEASKDKNAPKGPSNAYTIFYKHFHSEYQRKHTNAHIDGRQMTQLVAQAWKSLSDEEKKPFQERAQIEREKHAAEVEAYRKTDKYKQYVASNRSLTKVGSVDVFSKEFITFNKGREADLRNLRRQITAVEEQIGDMNDKIANLKKNLDKSYRTMPSVKRESFERERQIMIWCREMICALDKDGLLEEMDLDYNTPVEKIIQTIDKSLENPRLGAKIKKIFSGFVLEIF